MPFSPSFSAGRMFMFWQRRKHRGTSHIIYNSRSVSELDKAKTNKKESGLINEKRNKLAQAWKKEKNSTVYLTTVQKPTVHGVARVANFMKPLHMALMTPTSTSISVAILKTKLRIILPYNKMRNIYTCNKIGRPGTDRIGRHEVLLPINHNYKKYVVFEPLLIKTQGIPKAFF